MLVLEQKLELGSMPVLINSTKYNYIGLYKNCSFAAVDKGEIIIGNNFGCSGISICAHDKIEIGEYVMIGANTMIFDTDFHSIDFQDRREELVQEKQSMRKVVLFVLKTMFLSVLIVLFVKGLP